MLGYLGRCKAGCWPRPAKLDPMRWRESELFREPKIRYTAKTQDIFQRIVLPVSAGRNADVWRTRRADLMVADICGNVQRKEKGRARRIEQATTE